MVKLSRIAPELPVTDLNNSIAYYQQKLGFRVAAQMPAGDYAIVERDDVAIHLFKEDGHGFSPVGIHIFTGDLDELHAELERRGAHVSQGDRPQALGQSRLPRNGRLRQRNKIH